MKTIAKYNKQSENMGKIVKRISEEISKLNESQLNRKDMMKDLINAFCQSGKMVLKAAA